MCKAQVAYAGDCVEGKANGNGKVTFRGDADDPILQRIEGRFVQGKVDGSARIVRADGGIEQGTWRANQRVNVIVVKRSTLPGESDVFTAVRYVNGEVTRRCSSAADLPECPLEERQALDKWVSGVRERESKMLSPPSAGGTARPSDAGNRFDAKVAEASTRNAVAPRPSPVVASGISRETEKAIWDGLLEPSKMTGDSDTDGRRVLSNFMTIYRVKCGDSWFEAYPKPFGRAISTIIESRAGNLVIRTAPITEAQRLNGGEWYGEIVYESKGPTRKFSMEQRVWSPWVDGGSGRARMTAGKTKGVWTLHTNIWNDGLPLTCADVPSR